ncbi:hypothetical protein ABPG74_014579 [Tetrahymena malaccensis]
MRFVNIQQVKRFIHHHLDDKETKFMNLISTYFQYLQEFDQVSIFKMKMLELVISSLNYDNNQVQIQNYNQQKLIRKQFVGLIIFLYVELREQNQIQYSFYEIWNVAFPEDKLEKKKLTKYDVARRDKVQQKTIQQANQLTQHFQTNQDEKSQLQLIQTEENTEVKSQISKNKLFQVNQIQNNQLYTNSISNQFLLSYYPQYQNCDKPNADIQKFCEFNQSLLKNNSSNSQMISQIQLERNLFEDKSQKQEETQLVIESRNLQYNNQQFQQNLIKQESQNAAKLESNQNNIYITQIPQILDQQMIQNQFNLNNVQNLNTENNQLQIKQFNQMRQNNLIQHDKEYHSNLNSHQSQIPNLQQNKIKIEFDSTQECSNQIQLEQNTSSSIYREKQKFININGSQNSQQQCLNSMNSESNLNYQNILKYQMKKEDVKLEQDASHNLKNQAYLEKFNQKQDLQQQQNYNLIPQNQSCTQLKIKLEQNELIELKQKNLLENQNLQNKISSNNEQNVDLQQTEIKQDKIKLEQDTQLNNQTKIVSHNFKQLLEGQQIQQKIDQNEIQVKQEGLCFKNSAQFVQADNQPLKMISNQLFERQLSQQTQLQFKLNQQTLNQELNVKNEYKPQDEVSQKINSLTPQSQQVKIKKEEYNQTNESDDSKSKTIIFHNQNNLQECQQANPQLFTKYEENMQHNPQNKLIQNSQKKVLKQKMQQHQKSDENNNNIQNEDTSRISEEFSIENNQNQKNMLQKMHLTNQQNQFYQFNPNQIFLSKNNQLIENNLMQFYPQQLYYQQQIKYQTSFMNSEQINPYAYSQYGMIQVDDQQYNNQYLKYGDQQSQSNLKCVMQGSNYNTNQNANYDPSFFLCNQYKNIQLEDQLMFNQQKQYHQQHEYFSNSCNQMQQQNLKLIPQQQSMQDKILCQQINTQAHPYQVYNDSNKMPRILQ